MQKPHIPAAFQTLLSSSLKLNQKIYNTFHSAQERGAILHFNIALEDYNNLEMGYGLKTLEAIPQEREILQIPVDIGFNGLDLVDFKEHISKKSIKDLCWKIAKNFFPNNQFRQDKHFQNHMLMWQIILNMYYKDAYNYEMVLAFPDKDMTQPVYATTQIFDSISSRNLKKYYYENKLLFQTIHEMISKEAIYELSLDEMTWAYNNALARKMVIVTEKSPTPYQLILPIAEYINHSSTKYNLYVEPHYNNIEKESIISIRALRPIEAGEQLFFDYGPMYNKKFMNMYGFVDQENPMVETEFYVVGRNVQNLLEFGYDDPEVSIFDEFNRYLHSSQDAKKEICQKNSLDFDFYFPEYNLMLFNNKFDLKFLKFLRIIYLEDADILNNREVINSHDFSTLYSLSNEKKILRYIKFILERHYSFVRPLDHQALISSLSPIDDVDKFKFKCMYLLEQEEKFLLEKNISHINKKMRNLI